MIIQASWLTDSIVKKLRYNNHLGAVEASLDSIASIHLSIKCLMKYLIRNKLLLKSAYFVCLFD